MPTALIIGIGGQDGAYLSDLLLREGYRVCGLARAGGLSEAAVERLEHLGVRNRIEQVEGNLLDPASLIRTIEKTQPDEIYNFAVHCSSVASWQEPLQTARVTKQFWRSSWPRWWMPISTGTGLRSREGPRGRVFTVCCFQWRQTLVVLNHF
jgi:hypothetical protein